MDKWTDLLIYYEELSHVATNIDESHDLRCELGSSGNIGIHISIPKACRLKTHGMLVFPESQGRKKSMSLAKALSQEERSTYTGKGLPFYSF